MSRHGVEVADPEIAFPHLGDIRLRRVRGVRVAWRAQIERDVELDAALLDVRLVLRAFERLECANANSLSDFEAAIHGSGLIRADDLDLVAVAFDAVALRRGVRLLFDGERDIRGDALGRSLALDFIGSESTGATSRGIIGELKAGCQDLAD